MQRLKTACGQARSQCRPSVHRTCNSLQVLRPEILEIEQIAEELSRTLGDNRSVRLGESLKLRRDIRRLADDAVLLRASRICHLTDDHEAGGNPDPRLQRRGRFQRGRCRDQFKRRANRALGIVLVRFRIAKIEYRSVPVGVCDESVVPTSRFSDAAMIASDNLAYILRIHSGVLSAEQ